MRKTTKQTYGIFWRHARKYPWHLAVIVACLVAAVSIEAVIPFFTKRFFDVLAASRGPGPEVAGRLFTIILYAFLLWWVTWLCYRVEMFFNAYFEPRVYTDIMNSSFDYLQHHAHGFFINRFVGSLVRRVNRFADAFEAIADRVLLDLLPMTLRALITMAVLWYWHWFLGALMLVWLIVFFAANYFFALYKLKYDIKDAAADTKRHVSTFLASYAAVVKFALPTRQPVPFADFHPTSLA